MTAKPASAPPADALTGAMVVAAQESLRRAGADLPSSVIREALAASAQVREVEPVTVDNAPIGTRAPAIDGGHWFRMSNGWKWNGPAGGGNTYPRPGGDWSGKLIVPAPEPAPVAQGDDDASILREFFAGQRNSVGDYWHKDTIRLIVERLQATIADHARIVAELRETNRSLHRRTQMSEAAVPNYRKLIAIPPDGDGIRFADGNFGRRLLTWYCEKLTAEAEALEASLAACRASEARLVGALKGAGYCGMVNGCHPSEGRHEDTCIEARAAIDAARSQP